MVLRERGLPEGKGTAYRLQERLEVGELCGKGARNVEGETKARLAEELEGNILSYRMRREDGS